MGLRYCHCEPAESRRSNLTQYYGCQTAGFFYSKKGKKVGSFLFNFSNNYFSLDYHRLRSYRNSIRELKPDTQRWGRW